MFKMKRMTALLMSVLIMGSTVCAPAMAAEATGEETVAVQEEAAKQEEGSETESTADSETEGETIELPEYLETEEKTENAAENTTVEVAEPVEQVDEPENAAEDVTSEVAEPEEPAAAETEEEKQQPEIVNKDNQEASGVGNTEIIAGMGATVQEDEYLPLVIVDGVTDDASDGAYDALATWDAEKLSSLPVLDTDVSGASDGCIMMGLPGEYIADQQAVLDRINEIRREACEEGVINPETNRPLTMNDYVPLKWSHELEEIARIRAAETSMTGNHKRTNGGSWQSVDSEYTYVGECAAWNYSSGVYSGIEQWYNEKKYWLEGNEDKSGHYTTLIRPAMRYVGEGTFYSPYTTYPNTTLVEFYSKYDGSGLDESFVDMIGECIQLLEVNEGNLQDKPFITGILSGVKGDAQPLFLMDKATYSGVFTANTKGLLFEDSVSWSSSNSGIASVSSDGTVTARKCGSATITAQAENGSSASAAFTVEHVLKKIPAVEETCTETGLTEGEKCANCGKITIAQETIPAKGHAYGSWKVTKKATCTANGSREKICANCGDKVTETINATGHKWNSTYTVDKEATCTVEGSESKHCSVCNAINTSSVRSIPAKGHAYGSWKVTKKATCTANGSKEKVCANCGNKVTETIKATGHKWNSTYTVDKEAKCKEDGEESIHCSVCNAINTSTVRSIPAKGHAYSNWKVTKNATCTTEGSKEKVCANCGDKVTETIKAKGHKWNSTYTVDKEAKCKEDGEESIHCSVCNAINTSTVRSIPAKGHAYSSWKVTKSATCTTKGSKEKVCSKCGDKVTDTIKATGHKWNSDYTVDKSPTILEEGSQSIHCSVCGVINPDSVQPIPKLKGSWKKDSTGWWYDYGDGTYPAGKFESIEGKTFYFNDAGYRVTGWQKIDGKWYFFNNDGTMHIGWRQVGSTWYYFDGNGNLLTGWQKINGYWYYFNGNGARQTGLQHLGNYWYYFNSDGKLHTGWRLLDGTWYYFDGNGARVTGWQKINGSWYYFDGNGARQTGWRHSGNYWYYFNSDGKLHVGWRLIDGSWYYFDKNGAMVTGRQLINGKWYTFSSSGVRL